MVRPNCVFHANFVSELMPKLKTVLKDKKLEDQIQGTKDDEAVHFFASIGQLLEPGQNKKHTQKTQPLDVATGIERKEDEETEKIKTILAQRDAPTKAQNEAARQAELEDEAHMLDDDAGRSGAELDVVVGDESDGDEDDDDDIGEVSKSKSKTKKQKKKLAGGR